MFKYGWRRGDLTVWSSRDKFFCMNVYTFQNYLYTNYNISSRYNRIKHTLYLQNPEMLGINTTIRRGIGEEITDYLKINKHNFYGKLIIC